MLENVIKAILLSCVVASISFFISHTQLLTKQRKWLWNNITFFGMLIDCCYCLGHWVALILLLFFPVKLFIDATHLMFMEPIHGRGALIIDFILTWIVISWLAGLQSMAATRLWGE